MLFPSVYSYVIMGQYEAFVGGTYLRQNHFKGIELVCLMIYVLFRCYLLIMTSSVRNLVPSQGMTEP